MSANSLAKSMATSEQQEIDLKQMKSCQLKAGWYGLLSTVLGGAVVFAGLKLAPGQVVPKMYVPMISLGNIKPQLWCINLAKDSLVDTPNPWFDVSRNDLTIGCAAVSGWLVSVNVTKNCKLERNHRLLNSLSNGRTALPTASSGTTPSSSPEIVQPPNSKFGDKGFYQEGNR